MSTDRLRGGLAAALLAALVSGLAPGGPARAEQAYWLEKGGEVVGTCAGSTQGEPMKAANGNDQSVLATASVTCTDAGDAYVFHIDHVSVAINSRLRDGIGRDVLRFDWIGLAVYAGRDGDRAIEWLYDAATPIDGSLETRSPKRIYFGRIAFRVPKQTIQRASRFTFYLTAQGLFFHFGLL